MKRKRSPAIKGSSPKLACFIVALSVTTSGLGAERPSLPVRQPPATVSLTAEDLASEYRQKAATYAANFEAGVDFDDSVPEFAKGYLWKRLLDANMVTSYVRGSRDDQSDALQVRLQKFFAAQPEIASVKVSIACRTNQCELQFFELRDLQSGDLQESLSEILSWKLWVRLVRQSWYRQEFASHVSLFFPPGARVRYQFTAMVRHSP